jgi:translocator protein
VLVLLVAAGLGTAMILLRRDFAYALVLIWAFAGIVVNQAEIRLVAFSAGLTALILAILLAVNLFRVISPARVLKRG